MGGARRQIRHSIEDVCGRERLHSAPGGPPPAEFEEKRSPVPKKADVPVGRHANVLDGRRAARLDDVDPVEERP